jgi:putative transposase
VACDFFTVETVWLRTLYVLVFLHLETRRILGFGVTSNPDGAWTAQQARNLLIELGESESAPARIRFLLRDRDAKYTASFDQVFEAEGADVALTPFRTPRANAHCERWIGGARRECLDHLLVLGRRHLVAILVEYVEHHNEHRPHRGLHLRCPNAASRSATASRALPIAGIERRDRLGGLIHEYHARAA